MEVSLLQKYGHAPFILHRKPVELNINGSSASPVYHFKVKGLSFVTKSKENIERLPTASSKCTLRRESPKLQYIPQKHDLDDSDLTNSSLHKMSLAKSRTSNTVTVNLRSRKSALHSNTNDFKKKCIRSRSRILAWTNDLSSPFKSESLANVRQENSKAVPDTILPSPSLVKENPNEKKPSLSRNCLFRVFCTS